MAGAQLATLRLLVPAIVAAAVVASSCILPSYSIGEATTGDATSGGHGGEGGGAGAHEPVGSTGSGVGPGGAADGGSGIGGFVDCTPSGQTSLADMRDQPHGLTMTTADVIWIEGNGAVMFAGKDSPGAKATPVTSGACGLSGSNDQLVVQKTNGDIVVLKQPFASITKTIHVPDSTPSGGACAISQTPDGASVYGFARASGTYLVMSRDLGSGAESSTLLEVGTPVAIDASDATYVAWIDGNLGTGGFHAVPKLGGKDSGVPPSVSTSLCLLSAGKYAFTEPTVNAIAAWWSHGGLQAFLSVDDARAIACTTTDRAFVQDDATTHCAKIMTDTAKKPDKLSTLARGQGRACSIAIDSKKVFWTRCEPSGGVYYADLKQ